VNDLGPLKLWVVVFPCHVFLVGVEYKFLGYKKIIFFKSGKSIFYVFLGVLQKNGVK
jgi:hypothetical protein